MRADGLGEIDDVDGAAALQVDDLDGAPISAGLAHPGITVDRDVAKAAVRRDNNFVSVDVDTGCRNGFARGEIDEQRGMFKLIGDEEIPLRVKSRSQQRGGEA